MNLREAIKLFEVTDIYNESDKALKKKYKKLMVKYHPDNYNGDESKSKDINIAYNILKSLVKDSKQLEWENKQKIENENQSKLLIISIKDLIDIYKGKIITVDNININSKKLRRYNIMVESKVSLTHDNNKKEFIAYEKWNNEDKYKIHCSIDIKDKDLNDLEEVKINIPECNSDRDIKFKSQSIKFVVTLDFNIKLEIIIDKKIKNKKDSSNN